MMLQTNFRAHSLFSVPFSVELTCITLTYTCYVTLKAVSTSFPPIDNRSLSLHKEL